MSKSDCALSFFRQGFSCSQAVAASFAADYGLDKELALRLSQGFGGGIARRADWCGALTGAILVIGLKHGRTRPDDAAARDKTYALVQELIARFTARHGEIKCLDLLSCDLGTPEGQKKVDELRLHQTRCEDFVRDAASLLEELLDPDRPARRG